MIIVHGKGNRIGGVMVSVFTSSAVDRGLEHRSGITKDYKISYYDENKLIVNEMMIRSAFSLLDFFSASSL
jgi:hypothetical protein